MPGLLFKIAMICVFAASLTGCSMFKDINEWKANTAKKGAEIEKKKEKNEDENSFKDSPLYGSLNEYEREQLSPFYKNIDNEKKSRRKKIFGY